MNVNYYYSPGRNSLRHSILLSLLALFLVSTTCPLSQAQVAVAPEADSKTNDASSAATSDTTTVAAVAITSYDNLVSDINYLGSLAGRPEIGGMIEGFAALFTQGKGLAGLDKTKPWGMLVTTDGTNFQPVGCLPINNADELLGVLGAFGIAVSDAGDGVMEIEIPEKPSVFVKSAGGWAFLSNAPKSLETLPTNPDEDFAALVTEYDLAARISIQKIPATYREEAVEQLRAGLEDGLEREEDEDDEEYEMRRRLAKSQMENLVRLIEEIDEATIGMALDAEQERAYTDVEYKVLPGSRLSKVLASMAAGSKTNFAGFHQPDAAVSGIFVSHTDPALIQDDIENMKTTFRTLKEQISKGIDDDEDDDLPKDAKSKQLLKEGLNKILDAIQATAETGHMEAGMVLNLYPNAMTFVAGGHMEDPKAIENAFKKFASVAEKTAAEKNDDFPGIEWDADSHAGIAFHTVQIPLDDDEDDDEARKLFGPSIDVSLGIGEHAVYLGFGRDNLATAKGIIDASATEPNKPVPPVEFLISLAPILETIAAVTDEEDADERVIIESMATILRNEHQGRDHIRIVGTIEGNAARYRFEAEEGILKALGKAGEVAVEAAGAGGF